MIKLFSAASYWPEINEHKYVRVEWFRDSGELPIGDITAFVQDMVPNEPYLTDLAINYLHELFVDDEITQLQGILGSNLEINEAVCLPVPFSKIKGHASCTEWFEPTIDADFIRMAKLLPAAQQLPFSVCGYYYLADSETGHIRASMDDLMTWLQANINPFFVKDLKILCQQYGYDNRWDKILGEFHNKMERMHI